MFDFDFSERKLEGRIVLLAGGSGGLGSAVAVLLAREGADLVIGYRENRERAAELRDYLAANFNARVLLQGGDLNSADVREGYMERARELGGSPYGCVCLAGDPARVKFDDATESDMIKSMEENYIGPVLLAREAASRMMKAEMPGAIVLFSTMQAIAPFDGSINYAGPKTALIQAVKIMARQWGGRADIRVNAVAPGVNAAGMALQSIASGKYDFFLDKGIIPRFGKAEDIARTVRFLLEPDNYITGQVITVDGGLTLRRDK